MSLGLKVYLFEKEVGVLKQVKDNFVFEYSDAYLQDETAIAISVSLPLSKDTSIKNSKTFFAALLPESKIRAALAKKHNISEENDFALLNKLGGECAGAIRIGEKNLEAFPRKEISEAKLYEYFTNQDRQSLMSHQGERRISLAGVQEKIVVLREGESLYFPASDELSSHIIKPEISGYKGSAHNEYFCMRLAHTIGLSAAMVDLKFAQDKPYLLVRRYDRDGQKRLHQEDFTQALATSFKYQNESPDDLGFKDCFKLIKECSSAAAYDQKRFIELLIFNFLIGNDDAHLKNFSFLYRDSGRHVELAPCYDLLATGVYSDLKPEMAMKIGAEYQFRRLRPSDWEILIQDLGIKETYFKALAKNVYERTLNFAQQLSKDLEPKHEVYDAIIEQMKLRSQFIYFE